tara:strand:+ start:13499 stop:15415 length:1917 start_codon:yes stop_codon:yes gene_type:complete
MSSWSQKLKGEGTVLQETQTEQPPAPSNEGEYKSYSSILKGTTATPTATPAAQPQEKESLWDKFTGSKRETEETRNLPRLGQVPIGRSMLSNPKAELDRAVKFITSSSDQERLDTMMRLVPDGSYREDSKKNIIFTFPDGREAVVNKPGFDTTDALSLGKEISKYLPASRAAKAATQGAKWATRTGAQMFGAGATSLANEALSENFEKGQVVTETLLGGAGELAPVVFRGSRRLINVFFGLKKQDKELANTIAKMAKSGVFAGAEESVPLAARKAALKYESSLVKEMQKKAAPFYKLADEKNPTVNFQGTQAAFKIARNRFSKKAPPQKVFNDWQKLIEGSENFEQLASTYRIIRDSVKSRKFGEVGGSEAQIQSEGKNIVKEIRKALNNASPDFEKANKIYSGITPEIEKIKGKYIGRIARMDDDQLDVLAKQVFKKDKKTVKKTFDLLDLQSPGMSADLRAIELKRRFQTMSAKSLDEIPVKGIWKKLFPNKPSMRLDPLYQSMPRSERIMMEKMEVLTRKAAEARQNVNTQLFTGTSMTERGGGLSFASVLVSPITGSKIIKARFAAESTQREIIALAEILTNPEVFKRPEIKKFLSLNLNGKKGLEEASRIIIQLSNEISESISQEQLTNSNEE